MRDVGHAANCYAYGYACGYAYGYGYAKMLFPNSCSTNNLGF